jgi:Undecaprenyl-phosphate glucose phosphotransferase
MKSREIELSFLYLFIDIIILNIAILLMGWFTFSVFLRDFREISMDLFQGNLSVMITYFIFTKSNLYLSDGFKTHILRITKQTLIFLFVSVLIFFMFIPERYARYFLLEYTALFYVFKIIFYWLLYNFLKINHHKGFNTKSAIIVNINDTSLALRNIIETNLMIGYRFIGFVDEKVSDLPDLIGHPDELESLIDLHHIEMVFVTMSVFSEEKRLNEFSKICNRKGVHLRLVPENQTLFKSQITVKSVRKLTLINPQEIPMDNLFSRIKKRSFDLVISTLSILFLFSWLFPILTILIKLSSKGPVFFVQNRTGINNRIFKCVKFRSMKVNRNADLKQATLNDSRITRVGHFLRNTHLDELPQFFNVFIGQMSIVGPRPHMLKHTEIYTGLIKYYLVRHYVKPGITGWAQVSGFCGETDELWQMEKRVEYDMFYIKNWHFFWDIKILWCTVFGNKKPENPKDLISQVAV